MSVPVPAFTDNKMASSNLYMREEEPPDRLETAQLLVCFFLISTLLERGKIFKNEHNVELTLEKMMLIGNASSKICYFYQPT